jgi:hypothetical protein
MNLRATKQFRYDTRRLLPGDVFEASSRDARILLATRKVERVRDAAVVPPPPPAVAAKIASTFAEEPIAKLRAEYEAVLGKRPFMGWDTETLQAKIAAVRAE